MDSDKDIPDAPEQGLPKPNKSHKRTAAQRWIRILKIYFGIFLGLCVIGAAVMIHKLQWPKPKGDFDAWDFGRNGVRGVTVPFTSPDGLIHIQGHIGARPVLFTVDTGASASIIPKRLHLGTQYNDDSLMADADGNNVWTRPVFLPSVRIGDCTLRDFSAMVPDHRLLFSPIASGSAVTDLTLGNTALSQVVVTIDYVKQQITFQPPQQQALPILPNPITCMRFTWPDEDNSFFNGAPFIVGETNHRHLHVIVDTGTVTTLVVPKALEEMLVRNKCVSLTGREIIGDTLFGRGNEAQTTALTVSLPPDSAHQSYRITSNADVVTGWSDPDYILVGDDAFGADRVTIDYPHRTITIASALDSHVSSQHLKNGGMISRTTKTTHPARH